MLPTACRLALGLLIFTSLVASGQGPAGLERSGILVPGREEEMVRQWYGDYLGRAPGLELAAWVRLLQQGMSPIDVQAIILGSDELFEQQESDPATFVAATLESVTWTSPDGATVRRWLARYQALEGDRVALAREILLASQGSSAVPRPLDLASAILANSQTLTRAVDQELGGSLTGRQLLLRCSALTDAASSLRRTLSLAGSNQANLRQSHEELLRSYAAVQEVLFRIPGSAPAASTVARRIGSQLSDLTLALRLADGPPPEFVEYDQRALLQQSESVQRSARSVIQLLQSQSNLSLSHRSALRDLERLEANVEQFATLVRRGVSLDRLKWENDEINQRAKGLREPLLAGSPPLFTRVLWLSVESGLSQMRQTLRAGGESTTVPPIRPEPPPRPQPVERLLRLIDATIGQMDGFLTSVAPLSYRIPEVPGVMRQVRTARTRLLELRREVERGSSPSSLRETQRLAFLEYRLASDPWAAAVARYGPGGLPSLSRVETGMREITAEVGGQVPPPGSIPVPRPPGSLPPPRPMPPRPEPLPPDPKIEALAAAIEERLEKVDRQVTGLQRYNEARSILNDSRQMAANARRVVELVVAGRRPSELNRTIAAMQLLSERLDSDTRELDRKLSGNANQADKDRASTARREWLRARSSFRDLQDAIGMQ